MLYCKVGPKHNRAGPERAASHNSPPTMPGPPTMSTCSERHVRILPQRTSRRALPPPASVSCHEKHATDTILRTFCTKTTPFAHFQSKNDREPTATASCYESPRQYPVTRREKVFSKLGQSGQNSAFDTLSIPCRYPVSEKIADTLRHIWTLLGQSWTESAPLLRICATLPSRRLTPPRNSTSISARAGEAARNWALYAPTEPDAAIPATVESVAKNPRSATDESGRRVLLL